MGPSLGGLRRWSSAWCASRPICLRHYDKQDCLRHYDFVEGDGLEVSAQKSKKRKHVDTKVKKKGQDGDDDDDDGRGGEGEGTVRVRRRGWIPGAWHLVYRCVCA